MSTSRGALSLLAHFFEVAAEPRPGFRFVCADIRPADDGADRVVEVVRDAAGQLPDGFEFLRLEQLLLDGDPVGHIFHHHFEARIFLSRYASPPRVDTHSDRLSILALPSGLRFQPPVVAVFGQKRVAIGWIHVESLRVGHRQQILRGVVAENLHQGGIYEQQLAFRGDPVDPIRGVVHEAAIARFALPQRRLRALAFGDIQDAAPDESPRGRRETHKVNLAGDLVSLRIAMHPFKARRAPA